MNTTSKDAQKIPSKKEQLEKYCADVSRWRVKERLRRNTGSVFLELLDSDDEEVSAIDSYYYSSSMDDVGPDEWLDALVRRHNEFDPEIKALFKFDVDEQGEPVIQVCTEFEDD